MLAEWYVADVQRGTSVSVPGIPFQARKRSSICNIQPMDEPVDPSRLHAGSGQNDRRSSRRLSICVVASPHSQPDEPTALPIPRAPDPPDGDLTSLNGTKALLQSLLSLHRSEADEGDADSDISISDIQLKTHACWHDNAYVKTAQKNKKSTMNQTWAANSHSPMGGSTQRRCVMHPNSTFRSFWNLLVAAFVMYDLLVIPLLVFTLPSWLSRCLVARWYPFPFFWFKVAL